MRGNTEARKSDNLLVSKHDFMMVLLDCFPRGSELEPVKSKDLVNVKVTTKKGEVRVWFNGGMYTIEWSGVEGCKLTGADFPQFYSGGERCVSMSDLFDLKQTITRILK